MARAVEKYLRTHAEAEARLPSLAALAACGPWDHAVVIPARREGLDCLDAPLAPARHARVLCVVVVNDSEASPDGGQGLALSTSEALLAAVEASAPRWANAAGAAPPLALYARAPLELLMVDRCRPGRRLGPKDGVGLARKIGADLVLALAELGALRSSWIHTTDADARLPAEHFARVEALPPAAVAAVAPFEHVPGGDARVDEATLRYELSLRYYVAGLRWAASPFAFHTIGSLISVRGASYAAARGFPRRQAGEDFYLLNKLAKLGGVRSLEGAPVAIRARRSARAPFGTGPAVEASLRGETPSVYDPRVFQVLAQTLSALEALAQGQGLAALESLAATHPEIPELARCLEAAQALADRHTQGAPSAARVREFFDGFRTLKLIHALTRSCWPKRSWADAIEAAPFLALDPHASLATQRRALIDAESRAFVDPPLPPQPRD